MQCAWYCGTQVEAVIKYSNLQVSSIISITVKVKKLKPSSNRIIQGQFPGGQPHRSVILRDNVPSNNNKVFFIRPKLNQFRQILIQKNGQGNAFKLIRIDSILTAMEILFLKKF